MSGQKPNIDRSISMPKKLVAEKRATKKREAGGVSARCRECGADRPAGQRCFICNAGYRSGDFRDE